MIQKMHIICIIINAFIIHYTTYSKFSKIHKSIHITLYTKSHNVTVEGIESISDKRLFSYIIIIQLDLYYPRNSIIRGFWGQNLVRRTYMKYSKTSIIHTSIIRGPRLSAVFETTI